MTRKPKSLITTATDLALPGVRTITITLPIAEPQLDSYIAQSTGHLDARLDREIALPAFQQVHAGLRATNATKRNGRPVDGKGDVAQFVFELVADALSESESE